jgi:hypothetical protein
MLERYLGQLARRTLWFKVFRSVIFAFAATVLALGLAAVFSGPAVGRAGASMGWAFVLLCAGVSAAIGLGRTDELRGSRRALLLRPRHPQLAARVRSAAELHNAPNGSPELLRDFTAGLVTDLGKLPLGQAAPHPEGYWPMLAGAAVAALLGTLSLSLREDLRSGLYALTHPGREGHGGDARGLWVSHIEARVTAPGSDVAEVLLDPTRLSLAEGTSVALSVHPRFAVERALAALGELQLPLRPGQDGALHVLFTAEKSAALWLKARTESGWLEDPEERRLFVQQDAAPTVVLETPAADSRARMDEAIPLAFHVEDDHGLASVDLVVQLGPGRERRIRVVAFGEREEALRHADGTEITPAVFGVAAGQTLAVWIEARDRDPYPEPNIGRSEVRLIHVGESADGGGGPPIELLTQARDLALQELANRLEAPSGQTREAAEQRALGLGRGLRNLVGAIESLQRAFFEATGASRTEAALTDMVKRLARALREEHAASELATLRRADATLVAELEDDTMYLTDTLGRERLSLARASIERAQATQARMKKLLEELKRTGDPAKREALLAELSRARSELAEIAQKLATAEREVPGDFVNFDALRGMTASDPASALEKALAEGDMKGAEKAMAALEEATRGLSRGVSEGGEAFADSRFSPRAAQAEQARAALRELHEGQKGLAGETNRVSERLAEQARAEGAHREQASRMAATADAMEKRARELGAHPRIPSEAEAQASAAQRLRDARDALRQGNLPEARDMAERAAADLDQLASDMAMDARMFPGHDGAGAETARRAQKLSEEAARLSAEIARQTAPSGNSLGEGDAETLHQQAPRQRALSELAQDLEQKLREEGPRGVSDGLSRATKSMRSAAGALERGELREAEAHQRDALEKLNEVDNQLQREAQAQQAPGKGNGGPGSDGDRMAGDERVVIPTEGDDARRNELRRRVLDARRAEPPSRYAKAVERYYQEILR